MDSSGESSCKGREDGDDGATESERPLKKARFAWQVKGKHHLKTDVNHPNDSTTNDCQRPANTETVNDEIPLINGSSCDEIENELQCYVKSEEKRELNPSDEQGAPSLQSNNNTTNESREYPNYFNTYIRMSRNNYDFTHSVWPNRLQDTAEDQCISEWQAKQMITCCIDNTINGVIDRWINTPLQPATTNTRPLALNMAQFVNHLPEDNSVENEGILMAISAHGLQKANEDELDDDGDFCTDDDDDEFIQDSETNFVDYKSHENCSRLSPSQEEDDIDENEGPSSNNDNDDSDQCEHVQLLDTAVLYAINSQGLTASGTDYG